MGPCGWEIEPRCSEWDANADPDTEKGRNQARAAALAIHTLWKLTACKYGVCETVVRPCFRPPDRHSTYYGRAGGMAPLRWSGLLQGNWRDSFCRCGAACGCTDPATVLPLPGPIVDVLEVREDGQVIPAAGYRILNNRSLLRVDGVWPQNQDLAAADDAAGAFLVRYTRGYPLPEDGRYAAGDLACELLRGLSGGTCALPARAVSVARQGMDIQLADPAQYLVAGLTGIPSVDLWVKTENPIRAYSRPKVYNPDDIGSMHRVRPGGA